MISILIPSFNYDTLSLVTELHCQLELEKIDFEILVQDDCSPNNTIYAINEKINQVLNCRFIRNSINVGRAENRNSLISQSKFEWVLFLDCDVFPKDKNFIKKYLTAITTVTKVIFGGIEYQKKQPSHDQMLRWIYGKKREQTPLLFRKRNPYLHTLTSNILIHKSVFEKCLFDKDLKKYGYEDFIFINQLKEENILITHIENPVLHLDLETSEVFLVKTKQSLDNLKEIVDKQILKDNQTSLLKTYQLLNFFRLNKFVLFIFNKTEAKLKQNLISSNPSLRKFLFYKLGYFCKINSC